MSDWTALYLHDCGSAFEVGRSAGPQQPAAIEFTHRGQKQNLYLQIVAGAGRKKSRSERL